MPPMRVLLLEPAPLASAVVEHLRQGQVHATLEAVGSLASLHAPDAAGFSLLLVDASAPDYPLAAVEQALAARSLDLRWVVLLPPGAEASAAEAMRLGAFDYVETDRLGRLALVVQRAAQDIAATHETVAVQQRLGRLARIDPLTGLANRGAFTERTAQAVTAARRNGEGLGVLFLDLDNFKDVNDTLGHHAGDMLLRAVAGRLRQTLRETDMVARLGGDEFTVLLERVREPADCGLVAAKLLAMLAKPFHLNGRDRHMSASIGIALSRAGHPKGDELMMQADTALYRAKDEGRNRYCFFAPEMDAAVRERVSLAEELRGALGRGELELFYQPQVSQPEGRIAGMEALLRWNHPRRGRLMPGSFMAAAEKSGLMPALDLWVLEAACRQLATWREAGVPLVKLAINLARASFSPAGGFVDKVGAVMARYGVTPEWLDFEVLDALVTEQAGGPGTELRRMHMLGLHVVVDHFGIGPLSLDQLGSFGFARLKIAPRLLAGGNRATHDWSLARAALALARELGIDVMATAVESAAQVEFLLAAGCRLMQGYHLSPPVDAAAATALLRAGRLPPALPGVA